MKFENSHLRKLIPAEYRKLVFADTDFGHLARINFREFGPLFWHLYTFFWSLDQLVVETLGVAFVRTSDRPFVRPSVTLFLGNRSLLFYETLQLVRGGG